MNSTGFKLIEKRKLEEYRGQGLLFEHIQTGCQVFHLHNKDEENLFSFSFRTPPKDSTGVAHILEHSVLCGSRRFPVKDPFLSMMKGSVNTFLNAMTYPDKTLYPAATVLEKDFFNLMLVYGDAVFFPTLKEEVFWQEGHRLEWDNQGKLYRTGIVYNEMKGNYSTEEGVASEWSLRSLFPDTPYGVDSGGDPEEIPRLSYEDFLAFHKAYYHPGNCKIFLYGNIPSEKSLAFLDEHFLSSFSRRDLDSTIVLQPSWTSPRELQVPYPVGKEEDLKNKTTHSLNWKLPPQGDRLFGLTCSALADILMANPGAPLYKALLESKLGQDLSPVSGVEYHLREGVFSVALRGSDPEKAGEFNTLVRKTLGEIASKGLEKDLKEGCISRMEFRCREVKGRFGLRLLQTLMKGWNYDLCPFESIQTEKFLQELRRKTQEEKGYFESFIHRWLLDNPHAALVTVYPSSRIKEERERAHQKELETLAEDLDPLGEKRIYEQMAKLRAFQEEEDQEGVVPRLRKEDIPLELPRLDYRLDRGGSHPFLSQRVYTKGVLYNNLVFTLKNLDLDSLTYVPFFCRLLPALGLPDKPYGRLFQEINLKTGGFNASVESSQRPGDGPSDQPQLSLFISFKMLASRRAEARNLVDRILKEADFDNLQRIEEVLLEYRNDLRASLLPGGHSFVLSRSGRSFSQSALLDDLLFGVEQLRFIENLLDRPREELSQTMKDLRLRIFNLQGLLQGITLDERDPEDIAQEFSTFWEEKLPPQGSPFPKAWEVPTLKPQVEGLAYPTMVGYVSASLRGAPLGKPEHAAEILLASHLKTSLLWEKVRMKGGAYGAFAIPSGMDQIFSFASYRDPELERTLQAFRESLEEMTSFKDEEALEKNLITIIGKEIRPRSPEEKGFTALRRELYGISDTLRQAKREDLLKTSCADLAAAARRLLIQWDTAAIAVLADPQRLEDASLSLPGLKENRIDLGQEGREEDS